MDRKHRHFSHPRSFFELIIAGFSLVALPLIVALVTGAFYVDRLTNQSQEAVYRAVQATQMSRSLVEQVSTMERYTRQYLVLKDKQLLNLYAERHQVYAETSVKLTPLFLDDSLKQRLNMLNDMERRLYDRFMGDEREQFDDNDSIALTELAQILLRDSNLLIDSEMAIMHDMSEQARRIIYWELLAVVPGAVIFIIVFVILLSRPVRQIDAAIRRLGAGEFDTEIAVKGPRDIEYLGERLEWLRLRLKYLEEKKVKFLHYVSHELKTPLTSIRESAELLSEGVIGPLTNHQQEVTGILKKSSVNLQKMIEKLLNFNLPGQASLTSGSSEVHMAKLVETVVADHKAVVMTKQLKLETRCSEVSIHGDEEQLRAVLDNLLSNAIKYTPDGGAINLEMGSRGNNLILDVRDTGPGIKAEEREKVFEAFYRGDSAGKGLIRGSGLGLSIVREFVENHNGSIEVVGEEGHGAHFRVVLPMKVEEEELAWAV
ncbi:MAG: ATP-binding protein [Gammaproteobacteria bacterium]|nr:ATP-binding protein [Gammaproteobacteria bacterium]